MSDLGRALLVYGLIVVLLLCGEIAAMKEKSFFGVFVMRLSQYAVLFVAFVSLYEDVRRAWFS